MQTGGSSPTGTVTYTAYSDAACTTLIFTSASMPLGSPSAAFTPSTAGTYFFIAGYSGDGNNNAVATTCGATGETLTVNKVAPTITTSLSVTQITVGGSVFDTATMTGGFQAGGTVTYNFFTGSTCTGTATVVGSPVTVTGGVVPNSASQSFNTAGSFSWNAVYSGDANNNGNASPCEPLTVNPATGVGITTTLSTNTITVGGSVTDSAKLTGVTATTGGTVTYNLFTTGGRTGTSVIVSTATVTNGIVPNSASKTFTTAGADSWNAVYSGDTNNSGATSGCEPLAVNSPTTKPVLLSFQGLNLDDFDNGVGQLQIQVKGVNVTDIPHFPGTGDYTSYTNKWISFSIDITSFVHLGQNAIVF